jgi:hypothetical protein
MKWLAAAAFVLSPVVTGGCNRATDQPRTATLRAAARDVARATGTAERPPTAAVAPQPTLEWGENSYLAEIRPFIELTPTLTVLDPAQSGNECLHEGAVEVRGPLAFEDLQRLAGLALAEMRAKPHAFTPTGELFVERVTGSRQLAMVVVADGCVNLGSQWSDLWYRWEGARWSLVFRQDWIS